MGMEGKIRRTFKALDGVLEKVIDDRRRRRQAGQQTRDDGGHHRDFVDVLLDVNETDNEAGMRLSTTEIKAIILDMFAAGTDTTSTAMEWAMAELITHPDSMRKVQDELRAAVGGSAHVITEGHIDKLHYLKAVVKETVRLHPPIPLSRAPRATKRRRDTRAPRPGGHAGRHQRVGRRPGPGGVGARRGVRAGEVSRRRGGLQGAGLPADTIRCWAEGVPRGRIRRADH
ncbi:hypothetical protein VPH35_051064 [Triticum aestivum]